jgi:fatty acid desaturase
MKLAWDEWKTTTSESVFTVAGTAVMVAVGLTWAAVAPNPIAWIIGGFGLLRTFTLMHDLSHGALFQSERHRAGPLRSAKTNDVLGVLASIVCLIPYFAWKRVHLDHHTWAGWREIDPTEGGDMRDAPAPVKKIAGFLWRHWIPLLSLIFAAATFWASKKQMRRAKSQRERLLILWGARLVALCHVTAMLFASRFYFTAYLPAALVFLFLMEPLSIAQHAQVKMRAPRPNAKPISQHAQEQFARTLRLPRWFGQHVVLGFHLHSAHHAHPWIAGHKLERVPMTPSVDEHWLAWIVRVKKLPIEEVIGAHYAEGFAPTERLQRGALPISSARVVQRG